MKPRRRSPGTLHRHSGEGVQETATVHASWTRNDGRAKA